MSESKQSGSGPPIRRRGLPWSFVLAALTTILAGFFGVLCVLGLRYIRQWELSTEPPIYWRAEIRRTTFLILRSKQPDPAVHRNAQGRLTPGYEFHGWWGYGVQRTSGYTGGANGETVYFSYTAYCFPLLPPAVLFTVLAVIFHLIWIRQWLRHRRSSEWRAAGRCPTCGYDLRATPDRCPECGTIPAIAPANQGTS